jgi:hypothetical protein
MGSIFEFSFEKETPHKAEFLNIIFYLFQTVQQQMI